MGSMAYSDTDITHVSTSHLYLTSVCVSAGSPHGLGEDC
jgi:hypothetical protein